MHKFYDTTRPLYLETDTSSISLGAKILHVRHGMNCGHDEVPENTILHLTAFAITSLSSTEKHYRNIKCKALGILHGLEWFHYYCFVREVCIITYYKILVAILNKDVAMLSQW